MKITISTTKFQEMLSKVIKGASNNRLFPITSLLSIKMESGKLSLTTTDATNYLTIIEDNVTGEDGSIVVQADYFFRVISKMTCDLINIEGKDEYVLVNGNGNFRIPVILEDDGTPVVYPNPVNTFTKTNKIGSIGVTTIHTILTSIKPALAVNMELPCYVNYYMGECVIATDTYKISMLDEVILDVPKLVSGDLMNLLDVLTDDYMDIYSDGNKLLFESPHTIVYGFESSGMDNFNVELLKGILKKNFENKCMISKNAMLQLLDRMSLFVDSEFDKGEISLDFNNTGIMVSSLQSTGEELIRYIDGGAVNNYTSNIDIKTLTSQIKAQVTDTITIEFGDDLTADNPEDKSHALKIMGSNITSFVALN